MKGVISFGSRAAVNGTAAEWAEMEIGIYRGGSVATWNELFPKALIHALDINPASRRFFKND
jgi:hypothetical protein